jgi:NAD(P)-dependent dehydrogenase (short-subunit alcohol dehydrogenase family)
MKNYFIIGGSSGIGRALSKQLTAEGNQVYGTYYKNQPNDVQPNEHFTFLDVTDENLNLDFLPETIDGIIYCPGSINLLPFARIKPEDFQADFNLQVLGAIKVIQATLPKLKKGQEPSIVLFSTVAVQTGFNFHSQVALSKGAIEGLTKSLAAEFAPTIRVNAIAPSLTDTNLAAKLLNSDEKRLQNAQRHPLKKIGTPDNIAEVAAFLLSSQAQWITGQIIHVDGGISSIHN